MKYIIRSLYLDVEIHGTESDGFSLQRSLPALCHERLFPLLERMLDDLVPADQHWFLDRLEVEAAVAEAKNMEHLAETLAKEVIKQLRAQAAHAHHGAMVRRSDAGAANEAFLHFLSSGTLPWWFRLPANMSLEEVLSSSRHEIHRGRLMEALDFPPARKRLVLQFSENFLEKLLTLLSFDGADALREAAEKLGSLPDAPRRLLWQTAFSAKALGEKMSAASLIAKFLPALRIARIGERTLIERIMKHWPEIQPGKERPRSYRERIGQDFRRQEESAEVARNPLQEVRSKKSGKAESGRQEERNALSKEVVVENTATMRVQAGTPRGSFTSSPAKIGLSAKSPGRKEERRLAAKDPARKKEKRLAAGNSGRKEETEPTAGNAETRMRRGVGELAASKDFSEGWAHEERALLQEGLYIDCAGLVLLHPFLPQFFARLKIASNDEIVEPERALCLLHYLATGKERAPEYELLLPKLLCNLPLAAPVASLIELSREEKNESAKLLAAVIGHWEALRDTQADGLRGNFLLRPGKLSRREGGENLLQVETNACDILLDQLPWGIGAVKLPWMGKILWVEWGK